ncbi:MAG: hypothetical protein ACRCZF_10670, partial [Gemmataceae bacterium]
AGFQLHALVRPWTVEERQLLKLFEKQTTADARILVEESPMVAPGWNWSALWPIYTQRVFLGGLDPQASTEHFSTNLEQGKLAGRYLDDWTDAELAEFHRRYNIGWVLARSPTALARWRRLPGCQEVGQGSDGGPVVLFQLDRPRTYILKGMAEWESAHRERVVLTNIVPVELPTEEKTPNTKVVVLSLHYQAGMRVSPSVVRAERHLDPYDPIPMIRLRMPGPMSRIVISWENR